MIVTKGSMIVCSDTARPDDGVPPHLNDPYDNITIGKKYEVMEVDTAKYFPQYTITDDSGKIVKYPSFLFMTMDRWRDHQIKELGI